MKQSNQLITGIAAAILIGISDTKNFNPSGFATVALGVAVLAGLFIIERKFFSNTNMNPEVSDNAEVIDASIKQEIKTEEENNATVSIKINTTRKSKGLLDKILRWMIKRIMM